MDLNPLWRPEDGCIESANLTEFARFVRMQFGVAEGNYTSLHRWSITSPEAFWSAIWQFADVMGRPGDLAATGSGMPGVTWFPDARLNFARNLLRRRDDSDAIVFWGEDVVRRRLSRAELYQAVAQFAAALRGAGVVAGDRVAGYLPNMPEAVVAMLAAASIGAVWSSASPDFGVQGVLDRFGQIEPKILVAADGYHYNGKRLDGLGKLAEIAGKLPSVQTVIVVPYLGVDAGLADVPRAQSWAAFVAPHVAETEIAFAELPFAHPLYILFSSGTTGVPKCIVHSAGGTLLQHLKEHQLHTDVRPGDRLFYFTTLGWMMWNWLVSGLASGATLLLYDGSPFACRNNVLWDFAQAERCTHFGTSAKYLEAAAKFGLRPRDTHDLSSLRVLMSTGSPLVDEGFDYVYDAIKPDICLASISGGTDIVSCFVLGNPTLPVWRGEIQCKGLGMAVEVCDENGKPVVGEKGELVCTRAFPSMPIRFWNDPDGAKYRAAYFERFPGVWCHGDFCEETEHGGIVIYGRSDATLNPGGVRIGTAEIYRQVERLPEIVESLVIGQNWPPGSYGDVRVVLFVKLRDGMILDESLIERIKRTIRDNASPRHVPAKVLQVADIPRTKSGKLVELAVRNVVHGEAVKNIEALANPEALEQFRGRTELTD
ncbi:acetoacetate--CoA ligase [Niveibacterium umoris]|uniref:Acetoacetyl-CoA synthetase n=1 Tax=Niveibacterium umoris TaxID=1193620 RepID=A0A840BLE0_9RHOO|nr:acetoacetate--CoA ligase [Niveibacterium umoris]MBB4012378.1 acetoacetyl-CoA synthetase [Niveibacterium umoris]